MTFYRDILGLRGVIRRHYPTLETLCEFETTETYRQVQQMLKKLREYKPPKPSEEEEGGEKEAAGKAGGEEAQRADAGDHGPHSAVDARRPARRSPRLQHEHEQALHFEAVAVCGPRDGSRRDHRKPADGSGGRGDGNDGNGIIERVGVDL